MGEPKYLVDILNLKFAMNFAKMFLFTMLLSLAYLVFAEYSRIQDTCVTMSMFSRIAGNYALTASQDVDYLTNDDRSTTSLSYVDTEYKNYLIALESAASTASSNGDHSLKYAYDILKQDYDLAKSTGDLNANLKYTPASFNLPYISYSMLTACYDDAMKIMASSYLCNGTPSILLCVNDKLRDNDGNTLNTKISFGGRDDTKIVSGADINDSYVGAYDYDDGSGHKLTFSLVKMTGPMQKAIYGSNNFLSATVEAVLSALDPNLYVDPRIEALKTGADNYTIMYNVKFKSPFYYITQSRLLAFGTSNKGNNGTSDVVVTNIDNSNGLYCYKPYNGKYQSTSKYTDKFLYGISNDYVQKEKSYFKSTLPRDGQLCMYLKGSEDRFGSADFSYIYVS